MLERKKVFILALVFPKPKVVICLSAYVHIKLQILLWKEAVVEKVSVCVRGGSVGFCVSQSLHVQTNFLYDFDVSVFMLVCICMVTVKTKLEE